MIHISIDSIRFRIEELPASWCKDLLILLTNPPKSPIPPTNKHPNAGEPIKYYMNHLALQRSPVEATVFLCPPSSGFFVPPFLDPLQSRSFSMGFLGSCLGGNHPFPPPLLPELSAALQELRHVSGPVSTNCPPPISL